MASLQQLRDRLTSSPKKEETTKKVDNVKDKTPLTLQKEIVRLEIEEARYLLALIAKSDFSGKDIQIVYDTALKLQEIIKNNLEDNG